MARKLWRGDILSIFNNIIVTHIEKLPSQNYCGTVVYPNLEEKKHMLKNYYSTFKKKHDHCITLKM